jgi:hypothetical protein
VAFDSHRASVEALIGGDLDWAWVLAAARAHAVDPLVARNLATAGGVPPPVGDSLRAAFEANTASNLERAALLRTVIERLDSAGIAATAFKGPALAEAAYGDLSLRRFVDLDLVVPRADIVPACRVLAGAGFSGELPPAGWRPTYLRVANELTWIDGDGRIIELQWAVAPRAFAVDIPLGRLRRIRAAVGGGAVPAFAPEDLLVLLCVHGAKHRWERLGWIVDVAELCRTHPNLEWDRAGSLARATRTVRMVSVGLELARSVLGAEPTWQAGRFRADSATRSIAAELSASLFRPPVDRPFRMIDARFRTGLWDRLRLLAAALFLPTEGDLVLAGGNEILGGVLRPFRLAARYARRPAGGRGGTTPL